MEDDSKQGRSFEKMCALSLAVVATLLAITNLAANKFEIYCSDAGIERSYMHDWYNTKGIKKNLASSQADLLNIFVDSGTLSEEVLPSFKARLAKARANVIRYHKEKTEMKKGSAKVGRENWAQDLDGKLGLIIGTQEWDAQVIILSRAGDYFDLSKLFLEIGLLMGAISLLLHATALKKLFFSIVVIFCLTGFVCTSIALHIALQV